MKKTLLLMVSLLMGVNGTWADVTATLSGLNQVGDYYYPIYTLSESSTISSFTSSNGSAPAEITDETTLTFSHRGTVTLTSGETFEGKKYAKTNTYNFSALPPSGYYNNKTTDNTGTIPGFSTSTLFNRVQYKSGISNSDDIYTDLAGLNFTKTGTYNKSSDNLYIDYYYRNSTLIYGIKMSTRDALVTVNNDVSLACLDYYYSEGTASALNYDDLSTKLASSLKQEYVVDTHPQFTLVRDDTTNEKYYIYKSITTYTEVAESLVDATATLTGFAENGLYAYPVYTITATHDEDGSINPTLSEEDNTTVSENVLTYTSGTVGVTNVTLTYNGVNTTFDVPASIRYLKRSYDLGSLSTYTGSQASETNLLTGFTNSGTRHTILYGTNSTPSSPNTGEMITGMTFAASEYGWVMMPDYGLQVNGNGSNTYAITISDVTGGYAILYHNIGAKPSIAWDASAIEPEDMVAATDGTITLYCKNKNTSYIAYTKIELFVPVTNYIHTVYDLSKKNTYPSTITSTTSGVINGFTDATEITRYTLSNSGALTTLFNLTMNAQYGWVLCQNYGAYFSDTNNKGLGTFRVASPITNQYGILSYKTGDTDNPMTWNSGTTHTQSVNEKNGTLAFNVYDKDGKHETNKAWIYTQLDLFTPIANAKQDVTVSEVVGGMSTLRANHPMDFSGDDIKAYKATWNSSTNMVRFTRVNKVPANTPVLVRYKTATTATETVNFCNAEDADVVGDNILVAGTGAAVATTDGDYTNFILTTKDGDYGFYYANDKTVSATKAYLHIPTASLPVAGARLTFVFDDEENGVTAIGSHADCNFVNKNGFYNLQGQRISAPRRGLYIRDGKKMLMK